MKNLRQILAVGDIVTFPCGNGVSVSVIINPRSVFSVPQISGYFNGLSTSLCVMINQSFGTDLENDGDDGIRNHVVNVDSIAFVHNDEHVMGFASAKLLGNGNTVLHLHGVAIGDEFKGSGLAKRLIRGLLMVGRFTHLTCTSQNPVMFNLLSSMCGKIYPSIGEAKIPSEIVSLGECSIIGRAGTLDPKTFIIKDLYEKCLYQSLPRSKVAVVNDWFDSSLSVKDGTTRDGFLFVGKL